MENKLKILGLVSFVIVFSILMTVMWNIIARYIEYPVWLEMLIYSVSGAVLCFFVSQRMNLKAWRFAVCGISSWPLVIAMLIIYRLVWHADKQIRYNYYALSLGLIFFFLYMASVILEWFFSTKGVMLWQ